MTYFERARSSGIEIDLQMYSRLIGVLARTMNTNYWPLISRVYNEMIRDGLKPDEVKTREVFFIYKFIIILIQSRNISFFL